MLVELCQINVSDLSLKPASARQPANPGSADLQREESSLVGLLRIPELRPLESSLRYLGVKLHGHGRAIITGRKTIN